MDYFFVNFLPLADPAACVLELQPKGTGRIAWALSFGETVAAQYPGNPTWQMSEDYPNRPKVLDIIDNTTSMLIVRRRVKDVLEQTGVPMECLPFTLLDHKGRVASTEHFIVNPLGSIDCLNVKESRIEYSDEYPDEVIGVDRFVLDARKLETAPDLFRIKEAPEHYVVSHRLVEKLRPLNPTNLFLIPIEQAS